VYAVAGELAVDANHAGVVDEIGPSEAERFADPEAGVGEELEQRPVALRRAGQHLGELLAFEDRDLLRCPVGFLAGFELGDGVGGDPAAAHGEAEDLAEGQQRKVGRGGGERALVGHRPVGDVVAADVSQLARSDWPFGRVERLFDAAADDAFVAFAGWLAPAAFGAEAALEPEACHLGHGHAGALDAFAAVLAGDVLGRVRLWRRPGCRLSLFARSGGRWRPGR
jgi:hypothetical protein